MIKKLKEDNRSPQENINMSNEDETNPNKTEITGQETQTDPIPSVDKDASGNNKGGPSSVFGFDKTVEQTGYVNSKIDEIGILTKNSIPPTVNPVNGSPLTSQAITIVVRVAVSLQVNVLARCLFLLISILIIIGGSKIFFYWVPSCFCFHKFFYNIWRFKTTIFYFVF